MANQTERTQSDLKPLVLRGAAYLASRQVLGLVIGLAGSIAITRIIGPGSYGTFAAEISLITFLQSVSQWGADVRLIRSGRTVTTAEAHKASGFLLLASIVAVLIALLALHFGSRYIHSDDSLLVYAPVAMLPLVLLGRVPIAILESKLAYRSVALLELVSQILFYGLAIPLGVITHSAVAPTLGWCAQQLFLALGACLLGKYRPAPTFKRDSLYENWQYGLEYSIANWTWQIRSLSGPLIVLPLLGPIANGHFALATRIVEMLGFVKTATWRLSLAALAKVSGDKPRLAKAVATGSTLQVIGTAAPFVAFCAFAGYIITRVYGYEWRPVADILPFLAIGAIANSAFSLQSSALYALDKARSLLLFHLSFVGIYMSSAWLLSDAFGLKGVGVAELVAIPTYALLHRALVHQGVRPNVVQFGTACLAACLLVSVVSTVPWLALLGGLVILFPHVRETMKMFSPRSLLSS